MGCFYLCEEIINLKTDGPDGIELGKRLMEKRFKKGIIVACVIATAFLTACDVLTSFADGYDSGSRGYSYIGTYSSSTACRDACGNRGGSSYEYNPTTQNCFCK